MGFRSAAVEHGDGALRNRPEIRIWARDGLLGLSLDDAHCEIPEQLHVVSFAEIQCCRDRAPGSAQLIVRDVQRSWLYIGVGDRVRLGRHERGALEGNV
jgi:hypothetical protein